MHALLEASPQVTERLIERGIGEGTLRANRAAVRRILELRQLALTPELSARLEQCDD